MDDCRSCCFCFAETSNCACAKQHSNNRNAANCISEFAVWHQRTSLKHHDPVNSITAYINLPLTIAALRCQVFLFTSFWIRYRTNKEIVIRLVIIVDHRSVKLGLNWSAVGGLARRRCTFGVIHLAGNADRTLYSSITLTMKKFCSNFLEGSGASILSVL